MLRHLKMSLETLEKVLNLPEGTRIAACLQEDVRTLSIVIADPEDNIFRNEALGDYANFAVKTATAVKDGREVNFIDIREPDLSPAKGSSFGDELWMNDKERLF